MVILWVLLTAALLISCAADPAAATKAVASLLSALGTWPLWAVTTVRERAQRLIPRLLRVETTPSGQAPADNEDGVRAMTSVPDPQVFSPQGSAGEGTPALAGPVADDSTTLDAARTPGSARGHDEADDEHLPPPSVLGIILLSRLVYLCVALAIILGVLNLEFLRAPLVTLGIAGTLALVPPGVAMGCLYTGLPILFGALLLESLEIIPPHARLFPELPAAAKRFFDRSTRIACLLTIVMEVILFLDSWLLLQQVHVLLLEGVLSVVTAVLVIMAGVPAFWSLIPGTAALVALGLILVWLIAAGLALLLRIVRDVCELLATHVVPRLVHVLSLPGTVLWRLVARVPGLGRVLRNAPTVPVGDGPGSAHAQVVLPPGAPLPRPEPVSLVRRATYLFVDEAGRHLTEPLLQSLGRYGGRGSVGAAGYSGLHGGPPPGMRAQILRLGGVDTSPNARELAAVRDGARSEAELETAVLRLAAEKTLAALPRKGTSDPVVLLLELAWVRACEPVLRLLHTRLPRQPIVVIVDAPQAAWDDPAVRASLRLLRQLWQENVVLCSLLYDAQASPLFAQIGHLRQLGMVATTLAALLLAHRHAEQNRDALWELTQLRERSPFVSLVVGSVGLVPGPSFARLDPARWAVGRGAGGERLGRGELDSTRTRLVDLATQVQQDAHAATLALPDGATLERTLAVCLYPFALTDPRFATVAETLERTLRAHLPGCRNVMVSGNGCWDGSVGTRYFGQIGLLRGWDLCLETTAGSLIDATDDRTDDVRKQQGEQHGVGEEDLRQSGQEAPDMVAIPASGYLTNDGVTDDGVIGARASQPMTSSLDRPLGQPMATPVSTPMTLLEEGPESPTPLSIGRRRGRPRTRTIANHVPAPGIGAADRSGTTRTNGRDSE